MDQGTDDIQQSIAETRQDIEETRASMTEKLGLLEERVRETVESAKSTVEDIMDNVKGTVDETVEAVKETVGGAKSTVEGIVENVKGTMDDTVTKVKQSFDFQHQMDQRPWLMIGGSVLVGYLLGSREGRDESTAYSPRHSSWQENASDRENYYPAAKDADRSGYFAAAGAGPYSSSSAHAQSRSSGMWDGVLSQFQEEFDLIKGAVIGALMSNVRDMVKQSLPSVAPQLEKAIDSAATKLGAEPLPNTEHEKSDAERSPKLRPDENAMRSALSPSPASGQARAQGAV